MSLCRHAQLTGRTERNDVCVRLTKLTIVAHPDFILKPVAVSVPASSCRLPLRSAAPRPAETRAILTNGEHPHSISRSTNTPVYLLVVGPKGPNMAVAAVGGHPKRRGININPGILEARHGGMDDFAEVLTTNLDRPVLNRTNLTGNYDFTLTWDLPNETTTNWSPIVAALFPLVRKLGLRLDPARAPVEMLIIDSSSAQRSFQSAE